MTKNENLLFGIRAILETLNSGRDLEKIFIQKGLKGELIDELRERIKGQTIPVSIVPPEKLNRLTRKNHQGVVAFVSPVKYFPLDQVIAQVYESGQAPLLVLLDGVTDVRNFGSICRTAECMGAHGVIIPTKGSVQINADAVKTSAGALNYIPVIREPNLAITISELKNSGIKLVSATEKSSENIDQIDLTTPVCIVMGSEDTGISPEVLVASDERARVPISGRIDSLNVGSACSMILYEAIRQRSK